MAGGEEEPSLGATPVSLSTPERSVLTALRNIEAGPIDEDEIARITGLAADQVRGTLQRLRSKHLAQADEEHETVRSLTPRGEDSRLRGLPERRFLEAMLRHGGALTAEEATAEGLRDEERSVAIVILRRRGLLADGLPFRLRDPGSAPSGPLPEEVVLGQVADGAAEVDEAIVAALERRGLVREERRSHRHWSPSEEGRRLPLAGEGEPALGALTSSLLASGEWNLRSFRPYDVRAPVPFVTGARPHPYVAWLERFEDVLVGLGFEQSEGPLLETEFWNNDVLFMPQEHPARSSHDALSVEGVEGHLPPP